jgi:hypothetical protein
MHPGADIVHYMEKKIRESDYVLLICTPNFARKANESFGGAGYEKSIISGEIFTHVASPRKFVPILRSGSVKSALPSYLKMRQYVDFKNDDNYSRSLEQLLRHLYNSPKHKRPPLGASPHFTKRSSVQRQNNKPVIDRSYERAYDFAIGVFGMSLNARDAEAFAKQWALEYSKEDFGLFRQVYSYASRMLGMNLRHSSAKKFALQWVRDYADCDFVEFKEHYEYATNVFTLGLKHSAAVKYALNQMD